MNTKAFSQTHAEHVLPAAASLRKKLDKGALLHNRMVAETVQMADLVTKLEAFPFPPTDPTSVTEVHRMIGELAAAHKRIAANLSEQISTFESIIKDETVLITALEKQQEHLTK